MNPNTPSIFELSESEKLQLVQDLWDDLAATPDAVPVHDWQIQELARRKENLLNNRAHVVPWVDAVRRIRSRYGR
jgi:putative addiction module component (TIGR02574 family)